MKYLLKFEHHTSNEPIEVICKNFDDACSLAIIIAHHPFTENICVYSYMHRSELNCINEFFTILDKVTPFDYYN